MEKKQAEQFIVESMLQKGLVTTDVLKEAQNKDSLFYAISLYVKDILDKIAKKAKTNRLKITTEEANISGAYWLNFNGTTKSDFMINGSMLASLVPDGGGKDKINFEMAVTSHFVGEYTHQWSLMAWESPKNLINQIAQAIQNFE